ncbi:MAG: beta-N-acetylglucosaminidase domain-containing protein, partial [Pacificimonas sp.]
PWTWAERTHVMRALAPYGYDRFIYAPKADLFLRRRWAEAHPRDAAAALRAFGKDCADANVRFGVGLSPFELHLDWTATGRAELTRRVSELVDLGIDILALLFDDMRGDVPDLAKRQAEIAAVAAAAAPDAQLIVCPSYYSDDPVLDRAFGQRPDGYLEELGRLLPDAVQIFWTGPEVCSRELSKGHLARTAGTLGRPVTLWDNYPVNDGPRMSKHLHLRAPTGRARGAAHIAAHYVNPALQPHLTLLPAAGLAEAWSMAGDYDYFDATQRIARDLYGDTFGTALTDALLSLQDGGLDGLDVETMAAKLAPFDHPAATEVRRFLAGDYKITGAEVQTQ